jgi:hypothetical protein
MDPKSDAEQIAGTRRRLTEEMLQLDAVIDREQPGSAERLELLRRQANLSDEREALVSKRF